MTAAELKSLRRVEILDMPVDVLTMQGCIDRISEFVASGKPHLIVTADAAGIVQAQSDDELSRLYKEADMVTADSSGILWAAKRFGTPLPERVSGVDILDRVCAASADNGWRIFFLGSAPGIAELAAERMRLRWPGCNIVGCRHGYFPAESDAVVAAEVAATRPDVLFVAMGIPRQEKFIQGTREIIGAKVAMGVGGSFDVFSGRVRRAPVIMQRLRIEWLWRVMQDRTKLRKLLLVRQFVFLVLRVKKS